MFVFHPFKFAGGYANFSRWIFSAPASVKWYLHDDTAFKVCWDGTAGAGRAWRAAPRGPVGRFWQNARDDPRRR